MKRLNEICFIQLVHLVWTRYLWAWKISVWNSLLLLHTATPPDFSAYLLNGLQVLLRNERVTSKSPVSTPWKLPFWPVCNLANVSAGLPLVGELESESSVIEFSSCTSDTSDKHRLTLAVRKTPAVFILILHFDHLYEMSFTVCLSLMLYKTA